MSQVRINIKELIGTSNAIIQKFGFQVYDEVSPILQSGQSQIFLDFSGITNLTSGFCNASIGSLFSTFPIQAQSNIVFENIDKSCIWYEKITDAIELALNPEKAKVIDDAILALFE
jgi:hypothetical protein